MDRRPCSLTPPAAGLVPLALGIANQVLNLGSRARLDTLIWVCQQGNHQVCIVATTSTPIVLLCPGIWLSLMGFPSSLYLEGQ